MDSTDNPALKKRCSKAFAVFVTSTKISMPARGRSLTMNKKPKRLSNIRANIRMQESTVWLRSWNGIKTNARMESYD